MFLRDNLLDLLNRGGLLELLDLVSALAGLHDLLGLFHKLPVEITLHALDFELVLHAISQLATDTLQLLLQSRLVALLLERNLNLLLLQLHCLYLFLNSCIRLVLDTVTYQVDCTHLASYNL